MEVTRNLDICLVTGRLGSDSGFVTSGFGTSGFGTSGFDTSGFSATGSTTATGVTENLEFFFFNNVSSFKM